MSQFYETVLRLPLFFPFELEQSRAIMFHVCDCLLYP